MGNMECSLATKSKIIHVPRRFVSREWGGTETVIVATSHELRKRGYEVRVFTSAALSGVKHETVMGIPVRRFSYFYPRLGLSKKNKCHLDMRGGNLLSWRFLLAIMLERDIKLIHLHTGGLLGGFVRLVSKLRGIPYVLSVHGGALDLPPQQLKELVAPTKGSFNWGKILEILLRCDRLHHDAAAVICLCEGEWARMSRKYPRGKIAYVPNGVDLEKFASGDAARFRGKFNLDGKDILLCVGGFYSQKNHFTLVDAYAKLNKDYPRTALVLIGVKYDEAYYQQLTSQISSLNLSDSVVLLHDVGFDDETLADAYAAASVFVLPSKYETFGIVALEAFAASKPVVCGKVGGLASFIRDGENGLFFDVESADDLRLKIATLLDDRGLADRIAHNGHLDAQNYSWAKVTEKIINIYENA